MNQVIYTPSLASSGSRGTRETLQLPAEVSSGEALGLYTILVFFVVMFAGLLR